MSTAAVPSPAATRRVSAGETIFEENDLGTEMFVVISGSVEIVKRVHDMEKTLLVLGRGDFFGEMSLLEGLPRSATARAREDSELAAITGTAFEQLISSQPELAARMLKKMSERLREADRQIGTLLFKDDTSRVVHALTMLAEGRGEMSDNGLEIRLPFNHRDLAAIAGVTPDAAKVAIDALVAAKILRLGENSLHIQNPEALENYLRYLRWRTKTFAT